MPEKLTLRGLDMLIFAAYLAAVFFIAWYFGRRKKESSKDYFLAGNRVPWFVIGASMIIACISTEQIIGENGASYKYGFCIAQWDIYMLPPVTMLVWMFLPIYLRKKVTTVPEFLKERYGEGIRDIFSMLTVISYTLIFLPLVVYTASLLFTSIFPLRLIIGDYDYTILFWGVFLILITAVYVTWGGLASVIWVDLMQFVILSLGGVLIFILGMKAIDGGNDLGFILRGWTKLRIEQAERFHLLQPINHPLVPWPALITRIFTTQLFYNCANRFIVQKAFSAKNQWHARMGTLCYAAVALVVPIVDILPGMIAYQLNPALDDPNKAFTYILFTVTPIGWGIRGIILAGLLAAIMSTLGALINSSSTLFTLDFYQKRIRPQASEKHLIVVGRLSCILITFIAILWTPLVAKYELLFTYFQSFLSYLAAPAGAIFLLAIFWRRATHKAAIAAILIGLPFCLIVEFSGKIFDNFPQIPFIYISFAGWVLSMIVMIVVSLWDVPPDYEKIKDLMWSSHELREPRINGVVHPWYQSLWFWYITFTISWFALIYYFL